jgi:hypothetical protein
MVHDLDPGLGDSFDNTIIEILFSMDHQEDVHSIYLGTIKSQDEAHDPKAVEQRIDRLITEIGAPGVNWSRLYLGGTADEPNPRQITFNEQDLRHFELNGITAGRFLTTLVYNKLPIEWSTEGESAVKMSLAVGTDYALNLTGTGFFETAYIYDHEGADLDEDEPVDSELIYGMEFKADLFYCSSCALS